MAADASLVKRIFASSLANIGVTPDTDYQDAKVIRLINIMSFFGIFFLIFNIIAGLVMHYPLLIVASTAYLPFFISYPLLNKAGHFRLARTLCLLIVNGFLLFLNITMGAENLANFYYFGVAIFAVLLSRKGESGFMYSMILLSFVCYVVSIIIFRLYEPLYSLPDFTIKYVLKGGGPNELNLFIFMVGLGLIARHVTTEAEDRFLEEQAKLNVSNKKNERLANQLKLYLPGQFVDALVKGERETGGDYRRKRLTVFFSDVQGFTSWTDKLAPEEVREILNHYLSEMSAIAHKWGGTIDKFIGDALMIFFGDPEFTDDKDHALRCVKMAIQMQEKMEELRKEWAGRGYDEALHIRIGINTGYATVGNFGSEDRLNYTALGSAVNLASRLESAGAPDRITLSHTTWLLVKDEVACEPKGQLEVKGFAEPVKIYEVVRLNSPGSSRPA